MRPIEATEVKSLCDARKVSSDPGAACALAFSGGGIRSAAVSIGLLQCLARHGVLRKLHYISAVSGGGYALGWLTAWIARAGFDNVETALAPTPIPPLGRFLEPDPLHFLRRYASYLIPRSGLTSGDTLAAIGIYLRNLLLLQTMLIAAVMAVMALLQMTAPSIFWQSPGIAAMPPWRWMTFFIVFILGLVCWTALNLLARMPDPNEKIWKKEAALRYVCAMAARISGFLLAIVCWISLPGFVSSAPSPLLLHFCPVDWAAHPGCALFLCVATWAAALLSAAHLAANIVIRNLKGAEQLFGVNPRIRLIAWLLAMAGGSSLLGLFAVGFQRWLALANEPRMDYAVLGLPAVFLAGTLASFVYIGLFGNALPDAKREWLGRLAGYFLLFGATAGIVLAIALRGPAVICWIRQGHVLKLLVPGGWLFTTVGGVLTARSRSTGASPAKQSSNSMLEWLVTLAPPIFLLGLMLLVSWGTYSLATRLSDSPQFLSSNVFVSSPEAHCTLLSLCVFAGTAAVVAFLLGARLSANEFSQHLFYRNRLVRAFLGASHVTPPRRPDSFTGFALDDDHYFGNIRSNDSLQKAKVELANAAETTNSTPPEELPDWKPFSGPYPLWCCALNLTTGEDLAWQQRKAASFIYSPLFCGWDRFTKGEPAASPAYRAVAPCTASGFGNGPGYGGRGGAPLLGTAMAASGAAISPNWGFHTKPAIAALLAVFNVRIGWWTGNPARESYFKSYSPGAFYFIHELMGSASANDAYLYLSDGGHFENLGVYELVRRRVPCIIACDADADPNYTFGDLANCVERCRVDFGVQIVFRSPLQNIKPDPKTDLSKTHFALASVVYPDGTEGLLLYIKSSLIGDEPANVLGQRAISSKFPHDDTLNQFFNENGFEAYRSLGESMGNSVFYGYSNSGRPLKEFLHDRLTSS
jgi:hypothetical protein